MDNVKYAIRDKKLLLEIDLEHTIPGQTKSGNIMVATSGNWAKFEELTGFSFNMVLVKKPGAAVAADTPDETMVARPATMKTA